MAENAYHRNYGKEVRRGPSASSPSDEALAAIVAAKRYKAEHSPAAVATDIGRLIAYVDGRWMEPDRETHQAKVAEKVYLASRSSAPDAEDGWVNTPEEGQQLLNRLLQAPVAYMTATLLRYGARLAPETTEPHVQGYDVAEAVHSAGGLERQELVSVA